MQLDPRQLATILHALRIVQENANGPGDCVSGTCEHFTDHEPLTDIEIDTLCSKLNEDVGTSPFAALGSDCLGLIYRLAFDKHEQVRKADLQLFVDTDGLRAIQNGTREELTRRSEWD